jgi:hypothetical protein
MTGKMIAVIGADDEKYRLYEGYSATSPVTGTLR